MSQWRTYRYRGGPIQYRLEGAVLRYRIRGEWRGQNLRRRRFYYVVRMSNNRGPWMELGAHERLWEAKREAETDARFG